MAWNTTPGEGSKVFRAFVADALENIAQFDLSAGADDIKVALYNNDVTPDLNATSANSAYNAGTWLTTDEVYDGTEWAQGGKSLDTTGLGIQRGSGVVYFDAADLASGTSADLADVYGCLVYDETVTTVDDQGICYNYFGGSNSVTNGTFTIVWSAQGIFRFTL